MKRIILLIVLLNLAINSFGQTKDKADKKQVVFEYVETMPEFPGGQDKLLNYLSNNIKYPKEAVKNNMEGRAIIEFTVCEDGNLCDLKTLRDPGGGCAQEAERVIKNMPAWKPGMNNGAPVKVRYTLPILFSLTK